MLVLLGLAAAALGLIAARAATPGAPVLPPLVFVSRAMPALSAQIPGLGPGGRTLVTGGVLMTRSAAGTVEPLLREGSFYDVADPAVSHDGEWIAFAAVAAPESAWRIQVVRRDGTGLRAVTLTDPARPPAVVGRYDDFDPCWLPDGRIGFASTRYTQVSEAGLPASNLFVTRTDGTGLGRLTSDRNGAEEPTVDARTGRIVYARWWTNRFFASDSSAGYTTERALAVPGDTVNLWHAISITSSGDFGRLAGGNPRVRLETMCYQPVTFEDGTLVGVRAANPGLDPAPGAVWLQVFRGGFAPALAIGTGGASSAATETPARACAPAALPDGRLLFSGASMGGDFGLFVCDREGRGIARVVDLPGTSELDAAVLAPRKKPPGPAYEGEPLPLERPPSSAEWDRSETFRFDCLNVFTNAAVDVPIPDAPRLMPNLRIRFFGTVARPGRPGADSLILVRESRVHRNGAVHEDGVPSEIPMFEQLVDSTGRVLRTAMGPAHGAGFNVSRIGSGARCVGCHLGHSAISVPENYAKGARFNAGPSATVSASSVAPGTAGPRAVVDRRAKGPADQVAWVANGVESEWIRLEWGIPIELDTLVFYPWSANPKNHTGIEVREVAVSFLMKGQAIGQQQLRIRLSPQGTRVGCGGAVLDGIEVRPGRVSGTILGRRAAALAEIEALARIH